jgi:hypothetical protein
VRQLVDDGDLGAAGEDGVEVHLGELVPAVGRLPARHDLQAVEQLRGPLAAVGLDQADDHVGAAFGAAVGLAEHGVGLADAGGGAEVDPQLSSAGLPQGRSRRVLPVLGTHAESPLSTVPRPGSRR